MHIHATIQCFQLGERSRPVSHLWISEETIPCLESFVRGKTASSVSRMRFLRIEVAGSTTARVKILYMKGQLQVESRYDELELEVRSCLSRSTFSIWRSASFTSLPSELKRTPRPNAIRNSIYMLVKYHPSIITPRHAQSSSSSLKSRKTCIDAASSSLARLYPSTSFCRSDVGFEGSVCS